MKRLGLFLLATTCLVALSSCGKNETETGKVVHLPMRSDGPKSLDPVRGTSVYDNRIVCQIYETLLEYEYIRRPTDARTLKPLLLAELPTVSEDGKTYHFKLKEDVYFHDDPCFEGGKGRQLVSSDVFYSWKRLADNDNEPKSWWLLEDTIVGLDEYRKTQNDADTFDYDAPVEGFKLINDREFEVVLKEPIYRFMYELAMFQLSIVPREAVEKYGAKFSIHPVGTGPFTLAEDDWELQKRIVLYKNPNYHECYYPELPAEDYEGKERDVELGFYESAGQRLPLVDKVEITMYQQDQPLWLKFESQEIDYTQVPAENFDTAFNARTNELTKNYEDRGVVGHAIPLLDFIFYGFNMDDELLGGFSEKNTNLRKAISLALDWEERNESFYNGKNIVYDGMIPPGLQGYPEDGQAEVSYRGPNLELAREYLAKAGYPNGEGLPPLDYFTSRSANIGEQTDMLERQLNAVGIRINKNLVDFSDLMERIRTRSAPFFSFAWSSDYPDGENNLAIFYGPNQSPGSNHFNYVNPEFDKMYRQIRTMGPSDEREAMYVKMRDMVTEDAPYMGSMARTRFYVVNPRLKNFKPTEDFYNWIKYMDVEE